MLYESEVICFLACFFSAFLALNDFSEVWILTAGNIFHYAEGFFSCGVVDLQPFQGV